MTPPNEDAPRPTANAVDDAISQRAAHRAEWYKYIFAGLVTIFVGFFGFLGNRAFTTLDKTEAAVSYLRETVAVFKSAADGVQAELKDHEDRLRQDRELLVQHGARLQSEGERILNLEQSKSNQQH